MRSTDLTVQSRPSSTARTSCTGDEALILPTLGRTENDLQAGGPQFVSVEDSMCAVHASMGPARAGVAAPALRGGHRHPARASGRSATPHREAGDGSTGPASSATTTSIRDHIARVVPGFEDYNRRIRQDGGFVLPHPPRDTRTFPTPTGKAVFTVNQLEHVRLSAGAPAPADGAVARPVQHHDLRPRRPLPRDQERPPGGLRQPRRPRRAGLADGELVDLVSEWSDDVERVVRGIPGGLLPDRRAAARRPTTPRPTRWCRWTPPPRAATPRSRSRSSFAWRSLPWLCRRCDAPSRRRKRSTREGRPVLGPGTRPVALAASPLLVVGLRRADSWFDLERPRCRWAHIEVEDRRRDVDGRAGVRDVHHTGEATLDRCGAEDDVRLAPGCSRT